MKKALFGISLIVGIGICLALLFFPVLEFDRNAIYEHHKEEIEQEILANTDESKTYEEKKDEAINNIIYSICSTLQMYTKTNDVVYDEDGNPISSGSDSEAMMLDIYKIKEDGIKYTDLAKSIKNQCEYDINLYKLLKSEGKVNFKVFFANWSNPLLMIGFVLLIALEFACGMLLIIRSVKGVLEKKRNKVFMISVFGVGVSALLIFLSVVFRADIALSSVSSINDFVKLFAMSIKGTSVCYYSGIAFIGTTALSIVAKFMKY